MEPVRSNGPLDSIAAGRPLRRQILNNLRFAHQAYRQALALHFDRFSVHEFQSAPDLPMYSRDHVAHRTVCLTITLSGARSAAAPLRSYASRRNV